MGMMTKDEFKDVLVKEVEICQGCKATELVSKVVAKGMVELAHTIDSCIEELVKERRLVEVDYVLPNMGYRSKSFLLPAGSVVKVSPSVRGNYEMVHKTSVFLRVPI